MKVAILKALIVVTSHSELGDTGKKTGYYLPEVAHPYAALLEKGIQVDVASPLGGKAPVDPKSIDLKDPINKAMWETKATRHKLDHTLRLKEIDPKQYGAIIFAGGHGTMWDFKDDADVQRLARTIHETNGGVVAAVCHGPAALVNVRLSNGKPLVQGKNVAGFSNEEEEAAGLTKAMPFLLETALVEKGAKYTKAAPWGKHVIVDGNLVTGQNPASAKGVGEEVAKILNRGI